MSTHQASVQWARGGADPSYDTYPRNHTWAFEGGPVVPASAAPAYKGGAGCIDPEEALVAAAASCHMLTFLAIAAKKGLVVDSYRDQAVGHMEKNAEGQIAITRIELNPEVRFGGEAPDGEALERMHHSAHRNCFIANSIRAEVSWTPA